MRKYLVGLKKGKDQESIQSSTTPDLGKWQNHKEILYTW